jgi:hypothetical protein
MASIVQNEKRLYFIVLKKIKHSTFESLVRLITRNLVCDHTIMEEVCENVMEIVQFGFYPEIIVFPSQQQHFNLRIPDIIPA